MDTENHTEQCGMYAQNSTAPLHHITFLKLIVSDVEKEFNTKIYDYGVANKNGKDFESLIPFGFDAPRNAKYILYFMVPVDDADNIITNDYYEKMKNISDMPKDSIFSIEGWVVSRKFATILRSDVDLSNYLKRKLRTEVYSVGSLRVKDYNVNDNLVRNARDIEDLRYRFVSFFAV